MRVSLKETPLDCIHRWYLSSTEEEERRGDVAIHPFEDNVVVVQVAKNLRTIVEIQLQRYNPYTSSFFIFYSQQDSCINVLGGITWNKLYELGGKVNISQDLVQNRGFPLLYESFLSEPPTTTDCPKWWWIPVNLPRSQEAMQKLNSSVDGTMDDVVSRFQWIVGQREHLPQREGGEGSVSPLALGIFECTIEDTTRRIAFHTLRMAKEKTMFDKMRGMSEKEWLRLFSFNGLNEYMNDAMLKDPTPLDMYWFWIRYRGHSHPPAPPTAVFRVPVEECPQHTSDMPLYPFGLIHLTYMELSEWLWSIFVAQSQKLAFKRIDFYEQESRWLYLLHELFDDIETSELEFKRQAQSMNSNVYTPYVYTPPPPGSFDLVDIEDVIQIAPPCVKGCMEEQRFPENQRRVPLVAILQTTGVVSQASVFRWFEAKNAAFPHTTVGYKDAKARFNYEYLWNQNRGPTHCKNIIRGGGLVCPFAHMANYQEACSPGETTQWSGPHNLIRRRVRKIKK